ncbi:MAG: GNAT family N-acyltransferase [Planctomycetota bacterium]|nr:GNAT family N-acyltransferase [Planctomycetota bacterium]MDG1985816.1 GNAT family N-acyltransferase [Planctomycetota bacterium]
MAKQDQRQPRLKPSRGSASLLEDQHLIPDTHVDLGPYRLRFARTLDDLAMVRRLRYAVFNVELGKGLASSHQTGVDADAFDRQCQHLMVLERETGAAVGTYRMQTAAAARAGHGWYTAGEFELGEMPDEALETAAELGRACVAGAHRDKTVLFLLWHGLIQYAAHTGVQAFFGCSSLTGTNPKPAVALYAQLLRDGKVHPTFKAPPRLAMACPLVAWPSDHEVGSVAIPKLFATYLRHGGLVLGPPAVDHEFGTIDFLTWVQVTPRHIRLFGKVR